MSDARERRGWWLGALVAALYAAANAAVNPVVLDEAVVAAQVITRAVAYPLDHPHVRFYDSLFSLGNEFAAWCWRAWPEAALQSGVRNFGMLFATIFAPYALAFVLTRSPAWGLLASAIAASETLLQLAGVYPVATFPDVYSHGQLGQVAAVLIVTAWLARVPRLAALATGCLPMVHGGMVLPVYAWVALFLALGRSRPRAAELRGSVRWFGLGAFASIALWVWIRVRAPVDALPQGRFFAAPDGGATARNFVHYTDIHRSLPEWLTLGYGFHLLAFVLLALWLWRENERVRDSELDNGAATRWAVLFGVVVWSLTIVMTTLQRFGAMPDASLLTMPARFPNLSLLILGPLVVAALARCVASVPESSRRAAWSLVALGTLAPAVRWLMYAQSARDLFLFALLGILLGLGAWRDRHDTRRTAVYVAGAAALALAVRACEPDWQRPIVLLVASAGAWIVLAVGRFWWFGRRSRLAAELALAAACLMAVALPGRVYGKDRRWRVDLIGDFDRELVTWLESHAARDEFILTPAWKRTELQQKTGHPILFELETLWMLTYAPECGASIGKLVRDLYGVDYSDGSSMAELAGDERFKLSSPLWADSWRTRTPEEWQALGREYGFRLVVAPSDVSLALTSALDGPSWTLYVVDSGSGR